MKALPTMKTVKTVLLAAGIAMTLACGYSSKPAPATAGTMPTITTLSPASVEHGQSQTLALEVNGANFNSTAIVNFNGAAMSTKWTNAGLVTAQIPASATASAGTVQVTVTNPAVAGTGPYGGGGMTAETSAPMMFTIN